MSKPAPAAFRPMPTLVLPVLVVTVACLAGEDVSRLLMFAVGLGLGAMAYARHLTRPPRASAHPTATEESTPSSAEDEPMLMDDESRRFVLFPIQRDGLWHLYKQMEASVWHTAELDLSKDADDWASLSEGERTLLSRVLAFFAASDLIVNENLARRFADEVQWTEARFFYYLQMFVEGIHSETYSLLLQTYITDPQERDMLFNAIENIPTIKAKAEWALRWITNGAFAERLFAFAIVEGLLFSASFCSIFYFKKRGLLKGMCFANELIMRDEALHTRFACELYKHLTHPLDKEILHNMVREAVELEQAFARDCLPVDLLGMNGALLSEYIEFVADVLLSMVDCEPLYGTVNPFEFMDLQAMSGRTNFFERRVGEYQRANVMRAESTRELVLDARF
jgi:ribonucleoside-diphosphate reductase beta chain